MAIALRASDAGLDAALFSGELSTERLFERALAMRAKVRVEDLRRGSLTEGQRAQAGAAALALRDNCPQLAYIPPTGFAGLSDLLIDHLGIDLVVVDPIQSLVTGRTSRDEELAAVVRELKGLAVRRECLVLVVSHLDRSVRERADPRPQLADLGALGSLGQQADIVLGLYREEQYHAERDVDGAAEVHVLKQRDGSLGYADLFFYKQWVRFEDVVER
jgi:replicative DNA helicase